MFHMYMHASMRCDYEAQDQTRYLRLRLPVLADGRLCFGSYPGVRPVPLEIHIQGFEIVSLEARMAAMSRPAYR